jgi:hypothetical protein
MKVSTASLLLFLFLTACSTTRKASQVSLPVWMKGQFTDDYKINYTINDTLFTMDGAANYHILQWNKKEQYLLTKNDSTNKTDKGLYTRIDYMSFTDMEPYTWGFCLSIYNAKDMNTLLEAKAADRSNPRKGCNGFPFSRMKRVNQ